MSLDFKAIDVNFKAKCFRLHSIQKSQRVAHLIFIIIRGLKPTHHIKMYDIEEREEATGKKMLTLKFELVGILSLFLCLAHAYTMQVP